VNQVVCRLHLLPSAKPLKHRAPVHFHSGSAEIQAEVRLPRGLTVLQPGGSAHVRLLLRDSALLLPGDRCIIRRFSPVVTIGGGVILDIGSPATREAAATLAARLDVLSCPDTAARIALLVRETEFGISVPDLVARTGMREPDIAAAAAHAPMLVLADSWYVDRVWFLAARDRLVKAIAEFHERNPLASGIARQDLRSREMPSAPPLVVDALLAAADSLVVEGETVRSRNHRVILKDDEKRARAAIERAFEQASLAVPAVAEVLAQSGIEARRARTLLEILLREKRLVRISSELVFHSSALDRLRQLLAARKAQRFQVGQFKEWTGISRKYAIPLLEYLDRTHVTRREGDWRLVI
jgi:selenocysteine-specific elongation factor